MALVLRKAVLPKNVALINKCMKGRTLATTPNKKNPSFFANCMTKRGYRELTSRPMVDLPRVQMWSMERPSEPRRLRSVLPRSASCPRLLSRMPETIPCEYLPRTKSAIFASEKNDSRLMFPYCYCPHAPMPASAPNDRPCFTPPSPPNVAFPLPLKTHNPEQQDTIDKIKEVCTAGVCPCGPCGPACGPSCCLPPPCNTPPRCVQYMTGYYYYPYGWWFCGPYHVQGTCVPGGPVRPGPSGPCGPAAPCPGGPCGPACVGPCACIASNLLTACLACCAPCGPGCYGPCACGCGCGPGGCGPCGCGPFGPCGCGVGPCGPGCSPCGCGPCGPGCSPCGCGPCGPGCGPCGCGPCGPGCGPCGCGPCGGCPWPGGCGPYGPGCCGPCGGCGCCGPCGRHPCPPLFIPAPIAPGPGGPSGPVVAGPFGKCCICGDCTSIDPDKAKDPEHLCFCPVCRASRTPPLPVSPATPCPQSLIPKSLPAGPPSTRVVINPNLAKNYPFSKLRHDERYRLPADPSQVRYMSTSSRRCGSTVRSYELEAGRYVEATPGSCPNLMPYEAMGKGGRRVALIDGMRCEGDPPRRKQVANEELVKLKL